MSRAHRHAHRDRQAPAPSHPEPVEGQGAAQPVFALLSAFIAWLLRLKPVERFRAGAQRMLAEIAPLLFDSETFVPHEGLDEDDRRNLTLLLDDAEAMLSAHLWLSARTRAGLSFKRAIRPPRRLVRTPLSTPALIRRWLALQQRLANADALAVRLARSLASTGFDATPITACAHPSAPHGVGPAHLFATTGAARPRALHLLSRALAILRPTLDALPQFASIALRASAREGARASCIVSPSMRRIPGADCNRRRG